MGFAANISIVIPAHNEEAVIMDCLRPLAEYVWPSDVEIIVVCNGCKDRTAEVARTLGQQVRVLETPVSSKTRALNMGDAVAKYFPRFYVDADVYVPPEAIIKMAEALLQGKYLAVGPRICREKCGASWAVEAFYEIDSQMPSAKEAIGGAGVYGLSQEGRRRFDRFPDIICDDGFVRCLCKEHERAVVEGACSAVRVPLRIRELVKTYSRVHLGNYQLKKLFPEMWKNKGRSNWPRLLCLSLRPWLWHKLCVYGLVKILAKIRALYLLRKGLFVWSRDESSRSSSVA